jgi:hypothetical protein
LTWSVDLFDHFANSLSRRVLPRRRPGLILCPNPQRVSAGPVLLTLLQERQTGEGESFVATDHARVEERSTWLRRQVTEIRVVAPLGAWVDEGAGLGAAVAAPSHTRVSRLQNA